jgi:hypothetical protein
MSRLRRLGVLRGGSLVRRRRRSNGRVLVFAFCALSMCLARRSERLPHALFEVNRSAAALHHTMVDLSEVDVWAHATLRFRGLSVAVGAVRCRTATGLRPQ